MSATSAAQIKTNAVSPELICPTIHSSLEFAQGAKKGPPFFPMSVLRARGGSDLDPALPRGAIV
jgi:hypothetical protein